MTPPLLILEEFDTAPDRRDAALPAADTDEARLEAYESGYRSGWDDSAAARVASDGQIAADLARNLKDMVFTHEEARADVLAGLKPLLDSIVAGLLPTLVAEAVAPVVSDELAQILPTLEEARCELQAAPAACPGLERLAERFLDAEISVRAEPAYAEGQATLRFTTEQREIDLTGTAERIATAIRDFTSEITEKGQRRHA